MATITVTGTIVKGYPNPSLDIEIYANGVSLKKKSWLSIAKGQTVSDSTELIEIGTYDIFAKAKLSNSLGSVEAESPHKTVDVPASRMERIVIVPAGTVKEFIATIDPGSAAKWNPEGLVNGQRVNTNWFPEAYVLTAGGGPPAYQSGILLVIDRSEAFFFSCGEILFTIEDNVAHVAQIEGQLRDAYRHQQERLAAAIQAGRDFHEMWPNYPLDHYGNPMNWYDAYKLGYY